MLLATALALLQDVHQTFIASSNKPAAVAPKETITHHFFVSGIWAEEKTVDAAKICGGAENVVKRNPANIRTDCSVLLL